MKARDPHAVSASSVKQGCHASGKAATPAPLSPKKGLCIACGQRPIPKKKRRYCSDRCKKRLDFALFICSGLVQALRARYAAFSYTHDRLILDVLPRGSKTISRFVWKRNKGRRVADDLLELVQQAGRDWYSLAQETRSGWWASQRLLDRACRHDIPPSAVTPVPKRTPKLNLNEKNALKLLKLTKAQILSEKGMQHLKSAYRRKAKRYHPDRGDKTDTFVRINEAHARLLNWARNPKFCLRAALPNSWCYDGHKKRWAPPI
ncbi:MAG: DnaJ domain-containing protein [Deltaproteobacteria bacterium]|nr:DnaJ domain-containing protein [Deltaproteobacteria bacterium]